MTPTKVCQACNGTGRVEMNGVFADTLKMLLKHGKEITGAELAVIAKCKATTMNNRLAALERAGLVKSRRYGRQKFYEGVSR